MSLPGSRLSAGISSSIALRVPSRTHLYRHRHVFEAIERPHRLLVATTEHRPDGRRLDFGTEFLFAARDGSTLLTMIQTGLETAELREEHGRGVPNALARLDRAIRARK